MTKKGNPVYVNFDTVITMQRKLNLTELTTNGVVSVTKHVDSNYYVENCAYTLYVLETPEQIKAHLE